MRSEITVLRKTIFSFELYFLLYLCVSNAIVVYFAYEQDGRTALLVQAEKGDLAAVKKLLDERACVDTKDRVRSSSASLSCVIPLVLTWTCMHAYI